MNTAFKQCEEFCVHEGFCNNRAAEPAGATRDRISWDRLDRARMEVTWCARAQGNVFLDLFWRAAAPEQPLATPLSPRRSIQMNHTLPR